jgi:monovalent cation/hydrogen antiporter
MQSTFVEYIYLILVILGLVMIANKLKIAYPIILVLGGLACSFISRFSEVTIHPDAVFFVFLPPLLYEAAWQVSWKEFWKFRRVITSFAFPIVIITSCVVAIISYAFIPGFTLALGFLLGGIVSPPDAVSATTIMQNVKVPKPVLTLIEGESLLNDASSLIVFRFALAAVITGQFHFAQATGTFFLVVAMGIIIGVAVGLFFYGIHRVFPTTPSIDIVLTLVTPYCMYYAAEHFHFSGVLSVVSGGLLLSSKRLSMLSYRSRIEGVNVWSNLVFILNGLVFLLIGLQLPSIIEKLDVGLGEAILYGLIISLVLIVVRFISTFGAVVVTLFMSRFIKVADANPGWKGPLVIGWAGMRGVVSLAAALSIPEVINETVPFPHRNLILFITFVVILVTLVLQGLSLPWLIRKVKLEDSSAMTRQEQEQIIQKKIAKVSLDHLHEKYGKERSQNKHLDNLLQRLQVELNFFQQDMSGFTVYTPNALREYRHLYLEMLDSQRKLLTGMNQRMEFDEALIRKYFTLIDMEEYKIREKLVDEFAEEE